MSDFALAVIVSIGDLAAWLIGRLLGRTLQIDRDKAVKVGQILLAAIVFGAAIIVTILYS